MSKWWLYIVILSVVIGGVVSVVNIPFDSDPNNYRIADAKMHERNREVSKNFKPASKEGTIIILQKDSQWQSFEDFNLLEELRLNLSTNSGVKNVQALTSVQLPEKNLLMVRKKTFVPLADSVSFLKWKQRYKEYRDVTSKFISHDKKFALLFVEKGFKGEKLIKAMNILRSSVSDSSIRVFAVNNQLVKADIKSSGISSTIWVTLLCVLLIVGVFFYFARSLRGMLVLLVVLLLNLSITAIVMRGLQMDFVLHMVSVPCLILVLTFSDIMHVFYHHKRHLSKGLSGVELRREVIRSVAKPIFWTSLTNCIGFLVFLFFAENPLLIDLSILALIGVGVAYMNSRFLVVHLLEEKSYLKMSKWDKGRLFDNWIQFASTKRKSLFMVSILMISGLLWVVIPRFEVNSNERDLFSDHSEIAKARSILSENFFGNKHAEVIVRSKSGVWNKTVLQEIERVEDKIRLEFDEKYISSPVLLAKRFNRFRRGGHSKAFALPMFIGSTEKKLLSESVEQMGGGSLVSSRQGLAKIKFGFTTSGSAESLRNFEQLDAWLKAQSTKDVHYELIGSGYATDIGVHKFTEKAIWGILIGFAFFLLLMGIVTRSVLSTFGVLLVNLVPITLVVAVMFGFGISIQPLSVFLLSVLIGVSVDDSIFIMLNKDKRVHTFPILVTSAVLSIGFLALLGASYFYLRIFALLFFIGILSAYIMDVCILPVLIKKNSKE
jgi:predicted RND superfamily exporter protein